MRYILILIVISFSCLCQAESNTKDFILVAQGSGKTVEQAKKNAVALLSQNIFIAVKTDLKSSEALKNEDYKIEVTNNIQIQSTSYFSGLTFFNQKKQKKNLYLIEVGLSAESYKATVTYLQSQINFDLLNSANRKDLIIQQDMANFLISLFMYAKKHNLSYSLDYYQALVKYAHDISQILSAEVVLNFQIEPKANIFINGKSYPSFSNIFLLQGSYNYQVILDGYVTKKATIDVYKGDRKTYNIYLQKKLPQQYNVVLKLVNNSKLSSLYFQNAMQIVASHNQMKVQTTADNTLEWVIEPLSVSASFNNYYNIRTKVIVNLYENKTVKKSTVVAINYLSENNTPMIPSNILDKQLREKLEPFLANIYN